MANETADLINKSARKQEIQARAEGGVYRFYFAPGVLSAPLISLPLDPPAYWTPQRDRVLLDAYRRCGLWASAVNIAVTRVASLGYEVSGDIGLRVRAARQMLGRDWVGLMQRLGRDYVTGDNGGFMQIVRATSGYGSKVLGFLYLPASRCVRTGDMERPVVYLDELGYIHELRAHQVVSFSDMPDEELFGVGLSATSRAYDAIYEHLSVRQFFKEKATGRRPLALDFLSGISQEIVDATIAGAQADADAKGYQAYMGTALSANANNIPLHHVRIPLAELPSGFDQTAHTELCQIEFADAIGIDPVDLNPRLIGNRSLGAGSQAEILDDKQSSKGLISLRQQLLAFWNDTERWHPLPAAVTFAFSERDLKDQQSVAAIAQTRAATRAAQIASGEITADQARQLAVDAGDLPESFLVQDQTPEESLTDEDKATDDPTPAAGVPAVPQAPPAAPAATPAAPVQGRAGIATKEAHAGAMVALFPGPADAAQIKTALAGLDWPAGTSLVPPEEYHCTLAYLGKAADISPDERGRMTAAARKLSQTELPAVRFNGVARFNGSDAEGDAIVVLLTDQTLNDMAAIARRDIGNESNHTFLAHMTLAYIPKNAPTPTIPPPFDAIRLPALGIVFAGVSETFPLADGVAAAPADRMAATLKAFATTLASVTMPTTRRTAPPGYWQAVTKAFDEAGRIWTIAARQNIPQDEGETGRTIRYAVTNKNTAAVTLKLFAGNAARPEVAIRSVLFGRKGFRARKGHVLAFNAGGRTVFARRVAGAAANDWLDRSLKQIGPQVDKLTAELGDPTIETIQVSDIPGARLYRTAPPAPGGPRVKRGRGRGK